MRFQRRDRLLIDPIETGLLEADLAKEFGKPIDIKESENYFDIDLARYGVPEDRIVPFLNKRNYIPSDTAPSV